MNVSQVLRYCFRKDNGNILKLLGLKRLSRKVTLEMLVEMLIQLIIN